MISFLGNAVIKQIKARAEAVEEKGQRKPENKTIITALPSNQIERVPPAIQQELTAPIILLKESFNINYPVFHALTQDFEINMIHRLTCGYKSGIRMVRWKMSQDE